MGLDSRTFEFHAATPAQESVMEICRKAAAEYADVLQSNVPAGSDLDHVMRLVRDASMWANVAITRNPNGAPLE